MNIEITNLSFSYDKTAFFKDLNISFNNGIYAIIGPNGSGKSTLLKLLSTVLPPNSGKIMINDVDIYEHLKTYQTKIGYLSQTYGIYGNYTVNEYLTYVGALKGLRPIVIKINIEELLNEFHIENVKDKKIRELSIGTQKKIGIIQALLNDPDILLLDEPTTNMDPKERNSLLIHLTALAHKKIILFTTHIIKETEFVPCNVVILKEGDIIYNGKVNDIDNNKEKLIYPYLNK